MSEKIHVAVAIIKNEHQQVLVSLRSEHVHQGGLWEFPGGKVEQGESAYAALVREIKEELGVRVLSANPYKIIEHDYGDKRVKLDFYLVDGFSGDAKGLEGQQLRWQAISELDLLSFPDANQPVIKALQFSDLYMITGPFDSHEDFVQRLQASLKKNPLLVQLRSKQSTVNELQTLVELALPFCQQYQAPLIVNTDLDVFLKTKADGLHLSSRQLYVYRERPVHINNVLSVSCHNEDDLEQAQCLNADIILLSPVKATTSHPGVSGIGWQKFQQLKQNIKIPVYALGGMKLCDLNDAREAGAQGIAAISSLWRQHEG